MEAKWQGSGSRSETGTPFLILKVVTESEILIDRDGVALQAMDSALSQLREEGRIDQSTLERWRFQFQGIAHTLEMTGDFSQEMLINLKTDWLDLPGEFTHSVLDRFDRFLADRTFVRLEGMPPNTELVFSFGADTKRIPVTDSTLPLLHSECATLRTEILQENPTASLDAIESVAVVIVAAIEIWRFYREEQDRAERARQAQAAADEAARQQAEREREEAARQARERFEREHMCRDTSSGGPSTRELMDRISRTA